MDHNFLRGYIKAATDYGFPVLIATSLAKEALSSVEDLTRPGTLTRPNEVIRPNDLFRPPDIIRSADIERPERPNVTRPTFINHTFNRPDINRPQSLRRPSVARSKDIARPKDIPRTQPLQRPPDVNPTVIQRPADIVASRAPNTSLQSFMHPPELNAQLEEMDRQKIASTKPSLIKELNLDKDKPSHLYQLANAVTLASARIRSGNAIQAAKALKEHKLTTPEQVLAKSWAEIVKILNTNGYARYDESRSRFLQDNAKLVKDKYQGDIREVLKLPPKKLKQEIQSFKGIGPVGAKIFLREITKKAGMLDVFNSKPMNPNHPSIVGKPANYDVGNPAAPFIYHGANSNANSSAMLEGDFRHVPGYGSPDDLYSKYPKNTFIADSHGGGAPGDYHLSVDNSAKSKFEAAPNGHMLNRLNLPDIAKALGPKTNNIYRAIFQTCNLDGGCTPDEVQKYLPKMTNMIASAKGKYSYTGDIPSIAQGGTASHSLVQSGVESYSKLKGLLTGVSSKENPAVNTWPIEYLKKGTNWISRAFNPNRVAPSP